MNPMTDEHLMAYADGELDPPQREAVERALQQDPALAERARGMVQLRQRLQRGLAAELDERVPDALQQLVGAVPAAPVVDLESVRAQRALAPVAPVRARRSAAAGWQWWQWGGMAASLLLGVWFGRTWLAGTDAGPFEQHAGTLVAHGPVAQALSSQLAGEGGGGVAVQLSFVDRAGAYCRTFTFERAAGLACREGDAWVLQHWARTEPAPSGAMRQAATAVPPTLLQAVDARIAGEALDAAAERAARERGWRR
jgi:hypothetical protein